MNCKIKSCRQNEKFSSNNDLIEVLPKKTRTEDGEIRIMKMIARKNVPFTLVDDPLFKLMTTKTFGIAQPRTSRHYALKVLPNIAKETLAKLRTDIGNKFYSIITDGWSALNKPSPFFYTYISN